VLVPLGSCFAREKITASDYRKAALDQVRYKGQIYGAPEFTNQITIVVNNDALQKAGVNTADIQTTNWKRLKAANKKLLQVSNGRLTRIGFDPKIPEFFPLWVKWSGKDLISKDGLKAQLNSKEAVAALAYTVGLINDHGGWNKFKAFRDTFDFFGRNNQIAADQLGAFPIESFYYQVLADGAPVNITAKYFTNRKGGPITMLSGNAWAIPKGSKNPGLACKYIKALQSVDAWRTVGKERFNLRKRQGRAFTGLYTGNAKADVKIYEDIYQPMGNKDFDDAVALLTRAPRYGFRPPAPSSGRHGWTGSTGSSKVGNPRARRSTRPRKRRRPRSTRRSKPARWRASPAPKRRALPRGSASGCLASVSTRRGRPTSSSSRG
jgi:multiple sugar transport system substrate-binding protein